MTWGEADRLVALLSQDPSSQIAAALQGWTHPISREGVILLDSFDLAHQVAAGKRVKPHPLRPTKHSQTEHLGAKQTLSQDEIIAALRAAGHTMALPQSA